MIQLIVYTGFYWVVKVMESLLVVNSAAACALPSPWISTLWGLGARAKWQGWAQTADAHNLWPWWVSCSLKNHTAPHQGSGPNCGVPLLIKPKERREEGFQCLWCWHPSKSFLIDNEGGLGGGVCVCGRSVSSRVSEDSLFQNRKGTES